MLVKNSTTVRLKINYLLVGELLHFLSMKTVEMSQIFPEYINGLMGRNYQQKIPCRRMSASEAGPIRIGQ